MPLERTVIFNVKGDFFLKVRQDSYHVSWPAKDYRLANKCLIRDKTLFLQQCHDELPRCVKLLVMTFSARQEIKYLSTKKYFSVNVDFIKVVKALQKK